MTDLTAGAIFDRLQERLPAPSDAHLADALCVGRTHISRMRRRGSIPYPAIVVLCLRRGLDLDWILTGRSSPWSEVEGEP